MEPEMRTSAISRREKHSRPDHDVHAQRIGETAGWTCGRLCDSGIAEAGFSAGKTPKEDVTGTDPVGILKKEKGISIRRTNKDQHTNFRRAAQDAFFTGIFIGKAAHFSVGCPEVSTGTALLPR